MFFSPIAKLSSLQQKINCGLVDVSERVVQLSRHKVDAKEDITL